MIGTVAFLFSGQGSQYFQMGRELFHKNHVFRTWMVALDEQVRSLTGVSVTQQLYESNYRPGDVFNRTLYTHPAIFMVEFALSQVLLEQHVIPDIVVGSSLGEFVAAAVSGILTVEDALDLVVQQALLLERYCLPGKMLVILDDVKQYYQTPAMYMTSELAAINHEAHFVVSGIDTHIHDLKTFLERKQVVCEILPVSFAFHSSAIDSVAEQFKRVLNQKHYHRPRIPFFSALEGEQVFEVTPAYFWDVVRRPVQYSRTIQCLEQRGPHHYIDLGPGGTLANLARRNPHLHALSQCHTILSPFHQDAKNIARAIQGVACHDARNEG